MAEHHSADAVRSAACVLFFGHPLLDFLARASKSMLERYGICEDSVTLAAPEQLPIFTILLRAESTSYCAGGAAMNAARTMKWIFPEVNACCVGAVGCDDYCAILTRTLDAAGVQHLFEYRKSSSTGTCAALVVNKERSMIANLGAATELSLEHMRSVEVEAAMKKAVLFYAEGFFLNTVSSPENILLVAKHAASKKKIFCFNLNAPYISINFHDRLRLLFPYIDILFASKEDFLVFSAVMWGGGVEIDMKEAMMKAVQLPKERESQSRVLVVTCGKGPTFVASKSGVTTYDVPPVDEELIVDTTGAGDSFVGGFLAQYLCHSSIEDCVQVGHAAAAVVIRNWGVNLMGSPPKLKARKDVCLA